MVSGEPSDTGHFEFDVIGAATNYRVTFHLMTSSGGVAIPGSWEAFNPQPELPANGRGIGVRFFL